MVNYHIHWLYYKLKENIQILMGRRLEGVPSDAMSKNPVSCLLLWPPGSPDVSKSFWASGSMSSILLDSSRILFKWCSLCRLGVGSYVSLLKRTFLAVLLVRGIGGVSPDPWTVAWFEIPGSFSIVSRGDRMDIRKDNNSFKIIFPLFSRVFWTAKDSKYADSRPTRASWIQLTRIVQWIELD